MKKEILIWSGIAVISFIAGSLLSFSILSQRYFNQQTDQFDSGIELGYQDALNDVQNSTPEFADDGVRICVKKNGRDDSIHIVQFINPNFLSESE